MLVYESVAMIQMLEYYETPVAKSILGMGSI